jgi:hypothetical protein
MVHRFKKTFTFIEDPAHGWVKVPISVLKELGIESDITSYSYRKGDYAYLEEDVDAVKFIDAFKKKFGVEPKFNERLVDRTRIRDYPSYHEFQSD